MRGTRVFDPEVIDAARDALVEYRRTFVVVPHAVIMHPADVAPNPPHLFDMVVIRSTVVGPGCVRVCGYASEGIAAIG